MERITVLSKKSEQTTSSILRAAAIMGLGFLEQNPGMIKLIDAGAMETPEMRAILEKATSGTEEGHREIIQEAVKLVLPQLKDQMEKILQPLIDKTWDQHFKGKIAGAAEVAANSMLESQKSNTKK